MLVLDASATIAMLYGEIAPGVVEKLFVELRRSGTFVPQLWHLEVVNVLVIDVRKGRYAMPAIERYLSHLAAIEITVDSGTHERAWTSILELAVKHRLTSYDATYLELAVRKQAALATLDKALARAAEAEKVPLFWD